MGDKQEVCQRRQHGKAERPQRLRRAVTGGADLAAGLLEIILVADGCLTDSECDGVHRVRVVRVFNRLERGNQRLRAERVADAHARERARLAGRLHDEQVFVLAEQRNRALRAEVHIRLVDDDNAVLIVLQQVLEEPERYAAAGRRVRVRQDDTAVRLVVITHIDAEILVERHVFVRNAEQIAPDRIERVGDIRVEDGLVRAEERLERQRKHIVRAVAEEYLRRLQVKPLCDSGFECFRVRIRVNRKFCGVKRAQNLGHGRRGRVRILVGVQLDDVVGFRLLARHIRVDLAQLIEKRLVHGKTSCVRFL